MECTVSVCLLYATSLIFCCFRHCTGSPAAPSSMPLLLHTAIHDPLYLPASADTVWSSFPQTEYLSSSARQVHLFLSLCSFISLSHLFYCFPSMRHWAHRKQGLCYSTWLLAQSLVLLSRCSACVHQSWWLPWLQPYTEVCTVTTAGDKLDQVPLDQVPALWEPTV